MPDLDAHKEQYQAQLALTCPKVEVRQSKTKDPTLYVLHLRMRGMSKAIGRSWVLQWYFKEHVRGLSAHESFLNRSTLLVAGDRMGDQEHHSSDREMMVLGATNLALGDEVHPWADGRYQGQCADGMLNFLKRNRIVLESCESE